MTHNLLEGKRGIIFGVVNDQSIAWAVAKQCVAEGAQLVLTNTNIAIRFGNVASLAQEINAPLIPADATSEDDIRNLLEKSQDIMGGKIDFILHAVAASANIRKGIAYQDINYAFYQQTLDISAISFHKLLDIAYQTDAIADYGSVVALSYIAAQRAYANYKDMSDAKALLESIARNFGMIYGEKNKVRINVISQSPTITTAGNGIDGFTKFHKISELMSPLGNANAQECAEFCVTLFSDYTRKLTMQTIYHDGGFSTTGMSHKFIDWIESK